MSWNGDDNKKQMVTLDQLNAYTQKREKELLDEMMDEIKLRMDILFDGKDIDQTYNLIHLKQLAKVLWQRMVKQQEIRS